MHLQVDQGITKIGDTKGPTYFAFSNQEQGVIKIAATTKREIVSWLREKKKFRVTTYYQLFAACLFLLLKDSLAKATEIRIDNEYKGHEAQIKDFLLAYAQRLAHLDRRRLKEKIVIVALPKRNPADRLIHQVHKQKHPHLKPQVIHTRQLKGIL